MQMAVIKNRFVMEGGTCRLVGTSEAVEVMKGQQQVTTKSVWIGLGVNIAQRDNASDCV